MSKLKNTLGAIGALLGTAGAVFTGYAGTITSETFSQQIFSSGVKDATDGTSVTFNDLMNITDGNTSASTTVVGLMSSVGGVIGESSDEPDVWVVETRNSKPYETVEERAKKIYDNYNNNHIKGKEDGASLIAIDPAVAELVNEIINSSKSNAELLSCLNTLERIIKDSQTDGEKTEKSIAQKTFEKK